MKTYYHKKISLFSSFIFSFLSVFSFSQTGQKFHDTKGNIEVTGAGQLQYTLGLDLPPGVKNTIPKISLVYVSGAGNGLVGYGWNISGISSISRTGKNIEKDGVTKGVQLDYSDYYSFNGQRLILKSGEYGKDGAEYVTEKYSNIKIKSIGALADVAWKGPEYWEVTSPDGSQAWYGAAASGTSSARTPIDYNIVKSKDSDGNYVTYNYVSEDNTTVISNIQWGGNETQGKQHFNKIDFNFTTRPFPETAYIKGNLLSQSKLLESVMISTGGKQYKKYNVFYRDLSQNLYKYVEKITVLNSKNREANPVKFTYEDSPYKNDKWNSSYTLRPNTDTDVVGDFDGDGNLDILRYHSQTSDKTPQIGLYLYSDYFNFYNASNFYSHSGKPVFVGNSLSGVKDAIAVNLRKGNLIRNRQGFVTKKLVTNPATSKSDLELSFYGLTDNNELVLDYKKIIPNADYDNFSGTLQNGTRTTVVGLKNVDFNGDGLSEIVLQLKDKECSLVNINSSGKLPSECQSYMRYYVINPDESIQNNSWFYPLELYPDFDKSDQDLFTLYRAGDFNGDGIFDFLKLGGDQKPVLITFQKNAQGQYTSFISPFNPANDETVKGYWTDSLVGDYNGDGLSDLMMPGTSTSAIWYLYTSKGNGFKEETKVFYRPEKERRVTRDAYDHITISNPRTFVAYDINNDGKTDLIMLEGGRYYRKQDVQDSGQGVKYTRSYTANAKIFSVFGGEQPPMSSSYGISNEILYLNSSNINAELAPTRRDVVGLPVDQWTGGMLRHFAMTSAFGENYGFANEQEKASNVYVDVAKEARIKTILQGGVTTEITYRQLRKDDGELYTGTKTENYPYVEINQSYGMYVVSKMTQNPFTSLDPPPSNILQQDFKYRGLTANILGKGMVGFRKMARSSWYTNGFTNTRIWTGVEIDPVNDGIPIKEWSTRKFADADIFPADVSENNTQLLSFKSTTYQIDKILNGQVVTSVSDADKARVVTAILPKTTKGKDFLTGAAAESTITYGQYYLPTQSVSKINNTFAVSTKKITYANNPSGQGKDYYIGRITASVDEKKAYSDTNTRAEYYTYENNRLKTTTTIPGIDIDKAIVDEFTYDGFGNITQKLTRSGYDMTTRTEKNEYDTVGRFVVKKTDNLGLETLLTYDNWGQILTETDPNGNTITNIYDDWGKLLSSETNLEGITSYAYERDNRDNVTVIKNEPDGNISKTFTNKLGQLYKTSVKAFGQGQYVSKEIHYDILGRKIKESEPYFEGQSASQWNTITYDDTVFPAKVTARMFTGKETETTVSGLTTTVKESNTADYGRITSKTAGALGNIISSKDKGGTVEFSYNAAGEQVQAKYAENVVTTKYDSWGRKSEFNDPSNGKYKYEYDGLGQLNKTISPKGTKEYTYNNLGQLVSQKELSTTDGGGTTNKTTSFTYDNKGRLTKKSGTSNGEQYTYTMKYDPQGRMISSSQETPEAKFLENVAYDSKGKVSSYEKQISSSGVTTKASIENIYNPWNGELYQVKDKNSGKVLWELKETNAKGLVSKAKLGAAEVVNTYDQNGFLTSVNHSSAIKPNILKFSYSFDAIKNELKKRITSGGLIEESFDYDDNNRLVNWTDPVLGLKPSANRNIYDIKGRIMENDQVGTIKFENIGKLYQPSGMALNSEGVKNYDQDLVQSVTYNENNDPVLILGKKGTVKFQYGLTGMRQKVIYGGNFGPEGNGKFTRLYSEEGSFEIVKNNTSGKEKHIIYIGGNPYESNIVYLKNFDESSGSFKFLHKDYLGSVLAISNEAGTRLEQRHFDAWGNLTHLQIENSKTAVDKNSISTLINDSGGLLIDRGYTSHEHFMEVGIIHMNGRLYDPLLRRFLNADENIQDPANTQNYNKYGYVMNNPMMYNDPKGEFWMWAVGALVGGYLNGVQANGSWNPGNWDWQKNWSAVLGGAIGGAAISGTLGSIASNPGAIKFVLPSIVSGGLNSAFTGSSFLGGAIGGLSYTGNLFTNKITSTDGISTGYRYINSPAEDYSGDDWEGLTKNTLLNYVKANFCEDCSYGRLQQDTGKRFEEAFNRIMRTKLSMLNYTNNKDRFPGMYKDRPRSTVPDGVFDLVDMQFDGGFKFKTYSGASFAEVKAMDGTLYSSSNQGQIYSMLNYMGFSNAVAKAGRGNLMIGTTSDTYIAPSLYKYAGKMNIDIVHYRAYYRMISGAMHVRFQYKWTDITDSVILK
ncbi:type IV secretion protein Rhs [Chryseobacterium sp. Tr-659]|uniref:RHS repeat-associated core domain-containing protein n=1 Tax=Chryseobacterium sp. Tr-659 TaxID=2608340 RepID=UPI00141FF327|nr:RHS repeat-associated core domain-containing protein [Chryseobacterium sp. Tr-659]NIF06578.1 type IV secretion protein Rhs [Chryseobacterium sp. Tr-659]